VSEDEPVIQLTVLTPDRVVLDEAVTSVRFQQPDGWQGILPHHADYITRLVTGAMLYRLPGSEQPHYLVLFGGTLQIRENHILALTAAAEHGVDLEDLIRRLDQRQAEADALAFEALIEFTKVRTALVRALIDLPRGPEAIR
jgi:F0F1-type ATP synthase epsilon subunit